MPNRSIELHDSTARSIAQSGHELIVHFSPLYIHVSDGQPGVNAGTVWVQDAVLRIGHGSVVGSLPEEGADIYDGELTIGGVGYPNEIPVPLETRESVSLFLVIAPIGARLTVTGVGAQLEFMGVARYVEDFEP